eukprot:scaffold31493_cov101-Isochrysis_galbana.AAC.6
MGRGGDGKATTHKMHTTHHALEAGLGAEWSGVEGIGLAARLCTASASAALLCLSICPPTSIPILSHSHPLDQQSPTIA